jgi:hypothetical protein
MVYWAHPSRPPNPPDDVGAAPLPLLAATVRRQSDVAELPAHPDGGAPLPNDALPGPIP